MPFALTPDSAANKRCVMDGCIFSKASIFFWVVLPVVLPAVLPVVLLVVSPKNCHCGQQGFTNSLQINQQSKFWNSEQVMLHINCVQAQYVYTNRTRTICYKKASPATK